MRQPFIGEHCYAAQELVNLLVSGGAYANVFDGLRELDDVDPQTGLMMVELRFCLSPSYV